jgi:hypothetical protein
VGRPVGFQAPEPLARSAGNCCTSSRGTLISPVRVRQGGNPALGSHRVQNRPVTKWTRDSPPAGSPKPDVQPASAARKAG